MREKMYFNTKKKYDRNSIRFNIQIKNWSISIWNCRWYFHICSFYHVPKHIIPSNWQIRLYDVKNQKVIFEIPNRLQKLNLNNNSFHSKKEKNKIIKKFNNLFNSKRIT